MLACVLAVWIGRPSRSIIDYCRRLLLLLRFASDIASLAIPFRLTAFFARNSFSQLLVPGLLVPISCSQPIKVRPFSRRIKRTSCLPQSKWLASGISCRRISGRLFVSTLIKPTAPASD